jgi:hypothetical protein
LLLWTVFENDTSSQNFGGGYFYIEKVMHEFGPKMGWATSWAIFSQTHPVTLDQVITIFNFFKSITFSQVHTMTMHIKLRQQHCNV